MRQLRNPSYYGHHLLASTVDEPSNICLIGTYTPLKANYTGFYRKYHAIEVEPQRQPYWNLESHINSFLIGFLIKNRLDTCHANQPHLIYKN